MTEATVWRRSTPPPFSSPRCQASASGFVDRMPCPSNQLPASLSDPGRVLQISGACSSRSPSAQAMTEAAAWRRPTSPTWWRRQAARKCQNFTLHEPARLGQARQFGTSNQRQPQAPKPHLYLVLDDNENGFSIHKLDMDNDLDVGCGSAETPLRLPMPPILRIGPPTIGRFAQFAALGSHIIGIFPSTLQSPEVEEGNCASTLFYDTKTAALGVSKILPSGLLYGYCAAIAVGKRLYVFESYSDTNYGYDGFYYCGGLHCLAADPKDGERHWTWKSLSCYSHFSWSWNDYPPEFPFDPKSITAHVVHPRTGTIFVSAIGHVSWGTFAYGSGGRGQWKRRGDWVLPFKGPGHYDGALGAWVGLHIHSNGTKDADGYLCACPVMSGWQPPQWIIGREKLFLDHPRWRLEDAKLIHMAERGEYCLLERLLPEGANNSNFVIRNYVIRLTTFVVKYGEDGELTTMAHRPARFYKAPSYRRFCFDVQAFWM